MDPYDELLEGLGIATEVHFHAGFCAICYKGLFNEKLKHCAQCQLVSYCSKACQKADWKEHKLICMANAVKCGKNVFSKAKGQVTHIRSWIQFRTSLHCALSVNLGRPLEQFEREVISFPKVCEICKDSDLSQIFPCPTCRSVFYCSKEHLDEDAHKHIQWCGSYLISVGVDKLIKHRGSANVHFSVKTQKKFQPLPKDMTILLNMENGFSQKKIPTEGEEIRRIMTCPNCADELANIMLNILMSEKLSDPVTLLYALEQFYIGKNKEKICNMTELNVHVVGADGYRETLGLAHWEFFLHRLPSLKKLNTLHIGPEAIPGTSDTFNNQHVFRDGKVALCKKCEKSGKDFKYEFFNMYYHEYVTSEHYCKPDVIIAYNCGFHAFLGMSKDTWPRSIRIMTSDPTVPLIFTSYSKWESERDRRTVLGNKYASLESETILEKLNVDSIEKKLKHFQLQEVVTLPPHLNPFRGLRPIRDFSRDDDCDMFYNNHYITAVNGEKICK
ncbi:putative protein MSS51 homolog, mitochondrial [Palaemon carinicauda]|uniref:putative protein MSS51 homolog, mitochondrial n=1 Tax=Palaemon carinicauda TaxID=392227 RepID=UPI0035B686C2